MNERGQDLYTETKHDVFIPIASGIAGFAIVGAVDVGIGHVVSMGTEVCLWEGIQVVVYYTILEVASSAVLHPGDFVASLDYKFEIGIDQAASIIYTGDLASNAAAATLLYAIPGRASDTMVDSLVTGHAAAIISF